MRKYSIVLLSILVLLTFLIGLSVSVSANVIEVCSLGCEYSSIQKAVNAAQAGDTLEIKPWYYKERVEINKELTLKSSTSERVEIGGQQEGGALLVIGPSDVNVKLTRLTIKEGKNNGVDVKGEARLEMKDSLVSNNEESGILLKDSARARVIDSKIKNNNEGITLKGSSRIMVKDSVISKSSGSGSWTWGIHSFTDSNWIMVVNSKVTENTAGGIFNDGELLVINSVIKNNYSNGIYGNSQITVKNSNISDNHGDGISVSGENELLIKDTKISNNSGDGIYLGDHTGAEIIGCTISQNSGEDGVGILIYNSGARVTDSEIKDNEEYGISVVTLSAAKISNSTISKNDTAGILITEASNVGLLETTISGSLYGLLLKNTTTYYTDKHARVEVDSSTLTQNQYGIHLKENSTANISSSTLSENDKIGLYLIDKAETDLTNSNISGNKIGIKLTKSSESTLSGNKITNNEKGMLLNGSSKAEIKNSTVEGNSSTGISLQGSSQTTIEGSRISENEEGGIKLQDSTQIAVAESEISKNLHGIVFLNSSYGDISKNEIIGNNGLGIVSYSKKKIYGSKNSMKNNGTDLVGSVSGNLRLPLMEAKEESITFPKQEYHTMQHAIDALVPGGSLKLKEGDYDAGLTISKKLTLENGSSSTITLKEKKKGVVFSILEEGSLQLEGSFTIDSSGAGQAILQGEGLWD